jgi:hypothetical protein
MKTYQEQELLAIAVKMHQSAKMKHPIKLSDLAVSDPYLKGDDLRRIMELNEELIVLEERRLEALQGIEKHLRSRKDLTLEELFNHYVETGQTSKARALNRWLRQSHVAEKALQKMGVPEE